MGTVDRLSVTRGICLFIAPSDVVIVALIAVFVVIELRYSIVMLAVLTGILEIFTNLLYLVSNGSGVCHHVDHG